MLHQHTFRAMNTDVSVWLWNLQPLPGTILDQVEDLFAEIEAEMSRFRPDSGLSRLNAKAGCGPQPVSQPLLAVISRALSTARRSGGVFDPTVLPALVGAGYDRSFELLGDGRENGAVGHSAGTPDWRRVAVNAAEGTVSLPAGMGLDLGGIAKGWAVDQAAALLSGWGDALVDAGGDMRSTGAPGGVPWPVAIQNPFDPDGSLMEIELGAGAVATSTIGRRRWQRDGKEAHHLIDPRTARPSISDLHSVTVRAGTTVHAETAAKIALILGSVQGRAFLDDQGLTGLLVRRDGEQVGVGAWATSLGLNISTMQASPQMVESLA